MLNQKPKRTNCKDQEIINRTDLAEDWIYITEQILKEKCVCQRKSTCFEILRLLKLGDWKSAESLIPDKK